MKTLKIIGMVPLVLISANSFGQGSDDRAVPRGSGGGSSASSSDSGSRHSGGSSSSSSSSSAGSGSSSNSGGSSAASGSGRSNSSASDAAGRRPRPGTGTGDRDRYGNSGRDRYYGSPNSYYYYDPYSYSLGYPRSRAYGAYGYGYGYYDYGYSYGDYYGYYPSSSYRSYRYRTGNVGQLRTLVEPVKTRIYVDGYYAGIADDFDGLLQRLNVSPGRHDITLKLEGYNSHTFSVYANRDQTVKLRFDMVRGNGETRDSIGDEYDRRSDSDLDRERDEDRDSARDLSREVDSDRTDRNARRYVPPARPSERGELSFDIDPADASVYVDGEFFGKASQVTRMELSLGRHRIEVVRPGFRTQETEVDVTGEGKRVTVKLERR